VITEGDDVVGSSTNSAGNLRRDPVSAGTSASNGAECQPRRACATRADHRESVAVALEVTSDTADVCVGASVGVLDYPVGSDSRRHSNRARNRAASAELCACWSRRCFATCTTLLSSSILIRGENVIRCSPTVLMDNRHYPSKTSPFSSDESPLPHSGSLADAVHGRNLLSE
jgi:hypothetical protein